MHGFDLEVLVSIRVNRHYCAANRPIVVVVVVCHCTERCTGKENLLRTQHPHRRELSLHIRRRVDFDMIRFSLFD